MNAPNITVTPTLITAGTATFQISSITSHRIHTHYPSTTASWGLFWFGIAWIFCAVIFILQGDSPSAPINIVIGLAISGAGILMIKSQKPTYSVYIQSAGQDHHIFRSPIKEQALEVQSQITAAITT